MRSIEELAAGIARVVEGDAVASRRKVGRPAINGEAMTAAQRKARSRTLALGAVLGELEVAAKDCRDWRHYAQQRSTEGDEWGEIAAGLDQLGLSIARAMLSLPGS